MNELRQPDLEATFDREQAACSSFRLGSRVKRFLAITLGLTIGISILALIREVIGWPVFTSLLDMWSGCVITAAAYEFIVLRQSSH